MRIQQSYCETAMSTPSKRTVRRLKQVGRRISDIEEEIDRLIWELATSEHGETLDRGPRRAPTPPDPASSLVVALRENGGSRLAVNGGDAFDLPPRLTKLLLFALSGQTGPDGVKSYRLLSEATKEMDCTPNALSSLVYQFRQKLEDHDLDPQLLETTRRPAMIRFLVRNVVVIDEDRK